VSRQILERALASGGMLRNKAQEGHHSKTTILQLFEAQRSNISTLGEASRVKNAARVANISRRQLVRGEDRVLRGTPRALNVLKAAILDPGKEDELNSEQSLGISKVFLLTSGIPVVAGELGTEDASNTKHGPAGMLKFCLDVPFQSFRVLAEIQRVKAEVACKFIYIG